MAPDALDTLLADLRQRLAALYGERLVQLVLYGSHARGEATEDSDVDVLVVLSGEVNVLREIARVSEASLAVDLAHDTLVSLHPISEQEFDAGTTTLARVVQRHGVAV